MSKQKAIIIKKVKKGGHAAHHGGAWKVAYADFVTAMMAFFLLLWLLSMSSPEKRIRVSAYFKQFSIYTEGGNSFMGKTSQIFDDAGTTQELVFRETYGDNYNIDEVNKKQGVKAIGAILNYDGTTAGAAKQNSDNNPANVDPKDEGVKIEIVDQKGVAIFKSGSSEMTPKGKEVFSLLSRFIADLPNKIILEGHTDSTKYAGKDYSNWELSIDRAAAARRALQANGVESSRIIRIAGFADTQPYLKDAPADPRNRRITVILKNAQSDDRQIGIEKKLAGIAAPKYSKIYAHIKLPDLKLEDYVSLDAIKKERLGKEILTPKSQEERDMPAISGPVITADNNTIVMDESSTQVIDADNTQPIIDKK
ncbi:MAG: OmpA family protein [Candidatus Brocadiales bacterium]|nr:OmpA family protein [Candidatus Brocadiales bacterium]